MQRAVWSLRSVCLAVYFCCVWLSAPLAQEIPSVSRQTASAGNAQPDMQRPAPSVQEALLPEAHGIPTDSMRPATQPLSPDDAQPAPGNDHPTPNEGESATPSTQPQIHLSEGSLSALLLSPVTVYGVAEQPPSVPVGTTYATQYNVVTEEQIARQNSLDFYDTLRNVPGVMFKKSTIVGGQTSHSLYIRGRGASHPSPDLNIYFDDVPRSGVLYGQALADGIPVFALGGMEVYKSPQPSRFGSGYGMINFIPKYMVEDGYSLRVGVAGGSFGTIAENIGMGAKQGAFDIYAAQSHIGTQGHEDHTGAYQDSYYANLGVQLAEHWNVRGLVNGVHAETQVPNSPITDNRTTPGYTLADRYETETMLATLSLNNTYDAAHGFLKAYYNNTHFFIRGESGDTATSTQTNLLYGLRGRETFMPWKGTELLVGFDLDAAALKNEQRKYATDTKTTWEFPFQRIFSPYIAVSHTFGSHESFYVTPSAGVRYYAHNVFQDAVSPQAGIVLGYNNTSLNFSYARGVNYPSPVVLQGLLPGRDLPDALTTKDIKPEVVDHYEVALSHRQPDVFSLSATYFYDNGRDRLRAYMYGPAGYVPNADFFTSSTAKYEIHGLELAGSVTPVKDLELFAGVTWLWANAEGDDGVRVNKMPYTPSFALQTGFSWQLWENIILSGDFQYLHEVYAGTNGRGTAFKAPKSTFEKLTSVDKLPDISVLNLRLEYIFDYEPWHVQKGKVFIAVNNVLNTPYAYAMQKTNNGQNRELYYMPGTNVMVGLDITF